MRDQTPTEASPTSRVVRTTCPLDCPDACGIDVTVSGDRVARLDGTEDHPVTAGFICGKVRRFADHLDGSHRLLYPARRVGTKGDARFERITWDDALSLIADRLRDVADQFGPEAILPFCYGGSNGLVTHDCVDARFFRRLGASRLARTVCAAPSSRAAAGLYGKMAGVAFDDYIHARLIVVWGANPSESNIHLIPFINQARKNGAKLVVIDPRRTGLAKQADLHLALRPGADLAVALAVIRHLFTTGAADTDFLAAHTTGADELRARADEWTIDRAADRAGIAPADLRRFAEWYASISPAVIRCGWGLERNQNGGSSVAAVLALPAVAGKFRVPGGGYTASNSAAWSLDTTDAVRADEPSTRLVNMNQLGAVLAPDAPDANALAAPPDPPVQFLFVYNANPLATLPHQTLVRRGLQRDDLFTVVFDQVLTDTARYADVVLPATTFLEHADLRRSYGSLQLGETLPVIPPRGEARSNVDVFAELCRRLDLARDGDLTDPTALADAILASDHRAKQNGDPNLRAQLDTRHAADPPCGPHPVQFVDVFPHTPDRRVHLLSADLDRESPAGLYRYPDSTSDSDRYPLTLLSPATARTVSSTFGQLIEGQVPVQLHPDDARDRGIADGDRVRLTSAYGEVHCLAATTPDLIPGVAVLPKGLWSHNTLNGNTACALAPDTLADLGGGACFNDARVQVALLD